MLDMLDHLAQIIKCSAILPMFDGRVKSVDYIFWRVEQM
jgi:hypothetical protein